MIGGNLHTQSHRDEARRRLPVRGVQEVQLRQQIRVAVLLGVPVVQQGGQQRGALGLRAECEVRRVQGVRESWHSHACTPR